MTRPAIRVRHLWKRYGSLEAVRGITFEVGEGEIFGVIGPDGAGKTSTFQILAGVMDATDGVVEIFGHPAREARSETGYLTQAFSLYPDLTVAENLQISHWLAEAKGRDRTAGQDMDTRITAFFPEIRTFLQRQGLYLSGGQKKMVAIARAMALSPAILLLDEAFEGLAPVVVNRFAEVVKQIKAMGISVLIAESNLVNAAKVADRLYAIDRGEIIFTGEPKAVFANEEVMKTIRG
jgi:ABC-type branched-subunit amino acid transport system ATPase component